MLGWLVGWLVGWLGGRGEKEEEKKLGGKRTGEQEEQGKSLYTLTPDRPPLAASTGNNLREFALC